MLDLEQSVSGSLSELTGGSLSREVWLRLVDQPASTWQELDRDVLTPLSTLATMCVGSDCPPLQVDIGSDTETAPWLAVHSSGVRPLLAERRSPAHMLLTLGVLGLDRVAAWLDRSHVLGPLPPVVIAVATNQVRNLETAVLELTTVAEGLARRLWPDWQRLSNEQADRARQLAMEALRDASSEVIAVAQGTLQHLEEPSYPQRLLALADRAGQAVPEILGRRTEGGRPSRWKNPVVEARNDFAHRVDRGWLDEDRLDRYLIVSGSLRWLLTAVLLLETGLPAETLRGAVQHHQEFDVPRPRSTRTAGCVRRGRPRLIEQCGHCAGAVLGGARDRDSSGRLPGCPARTRRHAPGRLPIRSPDLRRPSGHQDAGVRSMLAIAAVLPRRAAVSLRRSHRPRTG
jgi:hypothetical protein